MVERRSKQTQTVPNILIVDLRKGWYPANRAEIPEAIQDSRRWQFGKFPVYLALQKGDDLVPIDIPANINAEESPERLFRALNWKVVKALFSSPPTWMEKLNPVVTLGAIGLMLFFIYLMMESFK